MNSTSAVEHLVDSFQGLPDALRNEIDSKNLSVYWA
jgi:hypothetical protein